MADDPSIRPFHYRASDEELADLKRRVQATKWPDLPTGVSAFREEIYQAPESWARTAYPHLVFYRAHDKSTHFAAWEQPQLLTEDLRATFRGVREA